MSLGERREPRPAALSKQRLRLWLRLLGASRAVEGELRERLRRQFDATLPRFDVLAALDRNEAGMTMTELSRFLRVSNGNVTGIVDRLVSDGLVVRAQKDGDRRTSFVRLTPRGRSAFAEMAVVHEGWVDELLSPLDGQAVDDLIVLLDRLRARQKTRQKTGKDER